MEKSPHSRSFRLIYIFLLIILPFLATSPTHACTIDDSWLTADIENEDQITVSDSDVDCALTTLSQVIF